MKSVAELPCEGVVWMSSPTTPYEAVLLDPEAARRFIHQLRNLGYTLYTGNMVVFSGQHIAVNQTLYALLARRAVCTNKISSRDGQTRTCNAPLKVGQNRRDPDSRCWNCHKPTYSYPPGYDHQTDGNGQIGTPNYTLRLKWRGKEYSGFSVKEALPVLPCFLIYLAPRLGHD